MLIVATHSEEKSEDETDAFFAEFWKAVPEEDRDWLRKSLVDTEYNIGLLNLDEKGKETLEYIKRSIIKAATQKIDNTMKVPSKWALLQQVIKEQKKEIMSNEEMWDVNIKRLPHEFQLENKVMLSEFLNFFHGNGLLLWFEEGNANHNHIQQKVILDIQWFASAVNKLIADKNHIHKDCKRRYYKEWDSFNKTGKIEDELVTNLWKDESSYLNHKIEIMTYMEKLLMIVALHSEIDKEDKGMSWYVPSMDKRVFKEDFSEERWEYSSILCFRFSLFAMFIYCRLVAYCMIVLKWTVSKDKESLCLYQTAAVFDYRNHTVIIGISENDIQVQVKRFKPSVIQTEVSAEIGQSVEIACKNIAETFHKEIHFDKGYKCRRIICDDGDRSFTSAIALGNEKGEIQCHCPITGKHTINVEESLRFWKKCVPLDTGKEEKVLKESSEFKAGERLSKIGCTYPFSKRGFPMDAMTSHIKAEVTRSVGLIYVDGSPAGTGFRVGDKYIITCLHVIKKIVIGPLDLINCQRIYIQFERMYHNQPIDQRKIFYFEPTLANKHEAFDVAVLELRNHGVQFPPPLTLFTSTYSPSEEGVHLIGHPGCVQMKEDSGVIASHIKPDNDCDRYIKELSQWSRETFIDEVDFYSVLRDSPRKILFHTTFDQGSSGSPGILIRNHEAYVFLVVSGGVPSAYYEGRIDVEPEKRIEFGYALKDIFDELQKKSP